jgi:uncharacterized protein
MVNSMITEIEGGYYLPQSLCFDITPKDGVEAYRIFVSMPAGDMPPEGWPVLYLTDGNACFPIAAGAHAIQSPHPSATNVGRGLIVAIGYPGETPFDHLRRAWDLTPPPGKTYPPFSTGGPDAVTGGAEALLAFIETELKPVVAAKFPSDPARQTLFGHSFGGLFALYALFNRPQSFNRYVAASPSIFWEDCRILDFEKLALSSTDIAKRHLHLSAGEFEGESLAPFQTNAEDAQSRLDTLRLARTAANAQEMAVRLAASYPGNLVVHHETFPGQTHVSALPVAICRAIQIAFEHIEVAS